MILPTPAFLSARNASDESRDLSRGQATKARSLLNELWADLTSKGFSVNEFECWKEAKRLARKRLFFERNQSQMNAMQQVQIPRPKV